MSNFQVNLGGATSMSYRQARLYNNKSQGWYIEYATLNDENQYQRCRIRLNRLWKQSSTMADFKVKAESVIMSINNQLQMHYAPMQTMPMVLPNPVQYVPVPAMQPVMQYAAPLPPLPSVQAEQHQAEQAVAPMPTVSEASKPTKRSETPVKKMLEEFIKEKSKELKKTSIVSYSTFCKQLAEWLQKNYPTLTTGEFTQEIAVEYLEFVNRGGNSNGKKVVRTRLHAERVSPRTYNNNMKMGRGVFTWAVEHCYLTENPFAKIKKKREGEKTRTIIPAEDRTRIFNYFKENNPAMCIIMQMVFTSLIRPIEITRIQVEDIDFVNHCIHLPGNKTKNGKSRDSRMDTLLEQMLLEHTKHAKPTDYLFADKSWKCGKQPMSQHSFTNTWIDMRDEMKLPKEYQLYSLRDSGINSMLEEGIPALDVMQAAGHSDLSMTTRYGNHKNPNLIKKLNNAAPSMIIGDEKKA